MTHELLGNIIYFVIGLAYFIYLVQELPTIGVGILNIFIAKNDDDKKKLQGIAGLYSDGIEVWLIAGVGLTFAAFPEAFGEIFSGIYVAAFLLLIAIIFRGLSVELMFKDDNPKWIKYMSVAWSVSGILLMFVLGVFFVNMFTGFPYENNQMDMNIFSIFSTASISGGIFLIALSVTVAAVWMKFNQLDELSKKAFAGIKKFGVIYSLPLMFALVLMGINNDTVSIVSNTLFLNNPYLLAIPLVSLLSFMIVTVLSYFEKPKAIYVFYVLGLLAFIVTGFLGTFPYILFSNVAFNEGLTITDTMSSYFSLTVISVVLVIILPIVLLYQGQKYIYFLRKDVK